MSDRSTRRIYRTLAEGGVLSTADSAHLAGCPACQAAAARAREFERALDGAIVAFSAPMPADPFAVAEARRGQSLLPAFVMAGAVLVSGVAGVALLLSSDPDPSPAASASAPSVVPSSRPAPSATPSPSVAPPSAAADDEIGPGDFAITANAEIPLYDRADGAEFAMGASLSQAYVIDVIDGWYLVQARDVGYVDYLIGWVPARVPSESGALVPALDRDVPSDCVDFPPGSYNWLGARHPQDELRCHSEGGEIVIRGYAIDVTRSDSPPYGGDPAWLAGAPNLDLSSVIGPAVSGFSVHLHLPPDLVGALPTSDREAHEGTLLEVTGHFNDPRSSTCALTPLVTGYPTVELELAEMLCRQRFVVDAVEVVEPEN